MHFEWVAAMVVRGQMLMRFKEGKKKKGGGVSGALSLQPYQSVDAVN